MRRREAKGETTEVRRNQIDLEAKFSTGLVTLWGNFIVYMFAESFDIYEQNYLYHIKDAKIYNT